MELEVKSPTLFPLVINYTAINTYNCIETFNKDYICTICLYVPFEPVNLPCGKFFCYNCIMKWLTIKSKCPHCHESINESNVVKNSFAALKISNMIIKCQNIKCKIKCLVGANGTNFLKHYNECPYTEVFCENCEAVMLIRDIKFHIGKKKICIDQMTRCLFCKISVKMIDFTKHSKSDAHINFLIQHVENMEAINKSLYKKIAELEAENKSLKNII